MSGDDPVCYQVAVRALCEFTAKGGDLDLRFTPAPTAQQGIAGHGLVVTRRPDGYLAELALSGRYRNLWVRGRADGYDPRANRLEEIKTHRGPLARMPANHRALHWAQAQVYGWLLCEHRGLSQIELALVYFDVDQGSETLLTEHWTADALRQRFESLCQRFIDWAAQQIDHRARRDAALTEMRFPHPAFRHGQRPLAEAVYKANCHGRVLLAQAPTGIGKTMGTLFPALKASPAHAIDRLFFLAAKTSGRALALDALTTLAQANPALPLRVLELVARDKACEFPDRECHGDSCPLASGFYDRLPAARQQAITVTRLDRPAVRQVALAHQICPYYLAQELARWADVVVGDYNYYFDTSALLHNLVVANGWRVSLLVDEAHNLVDRARAMYSAKLDRAEVAALRRAAPGPVRRALAALPRAWRALHAPPSDDAATPRQGAYQVLDAVPGKLIDALQRMTSAIGHYLTDHPVGLDPAILRLYFDAQHFLRIAEQFDHHSICDITVTAPGTGPSRRGVSSIICLRNVVPAPFIKPRLDAAHSLTLFSATLSPWHYHCNSLGLPQDTVCLDTPAPFTADQLSVQLVESISTRYRDRQASLAPIVELMARQYRDRPGNYLSFVSSFDYLDRLAALLRQRYPDIPIWQQSPGMPEALREAFVGRFVDGGRGIGFAVLGGLFGEGIDLPGDRLVGAFIATLGLPQWNPVNEAFRLRLQRLFGEGCGYDYAYLYPGIQRVVQAAGRVIRTPQDRGVVHLIDDRFTQPQVRALLPAWWRPQRASQRP